MTSVAGSSSYYLGGVISYANSMKSTYLNVEENMINTQGAVSEDVARAMADGMRKKSNADITLSVTGIAGPDGGNEEKPVGTVFIGMADKKDTRVYRFLFSGNRYEIQQITAQTALDIVRCSLLKSITN